MSTKKNTDQSVRIIVSVIMSIAMGLVSSIFVAQNPSAKIPPFPVFCLLNITESIVVGIFVAIFIPLQKISEALVKNIKSGRSSAKYGLLYAIPMAIGNGLIVSGCVSFINIAVAHSRMDIESRPPILLMWSSSWLPIIVPTTIIAYLLSLFFTPLIRRSLSIAIKKQDSGRKLRFFQIEILVIFAAVIAGVTIVMDLVVVEKSKATIRNKVSELVAANSRQIELNIDAYLERMRDTSTLLFSDKVYFGYDATDEKIDAYDKVKIEEAIRDRIVDIGLINNYSDFGIVYADNHKVGWISKGTTDLFSDGNMYGPLSGLIDKNPDQEAWGFGINGGVDRIYYLKRMNDNAILVSSVYTRELSSVFVYPEQIDDMDIWLTDKEGKIIYSSNQEDAGNKIPEDIENIIGNNISKEGASSTITAEKYFININVCANGWNVICSVPAKIVLKETNELRSFTMRISGLMAIIFVLSGLLFIRKVSVPIDDLVTSLQYKAEIDRLSGVMNKGTFQEATEMMLLDKESEDCYAFIMMDMDNFKMVNDQRGHSYGDQVIIRFGKLLRSVFDNDTIIGRLGGDEFAIYIQNQKGQNKDFDLKAMVSEKLSEVMDKFENEFKDEKDSCSLSFSAGVYVNNHKKAEFTELYEKADVALYKSKNTGKSKYTFYGEEKK